MPSWRNNKVGKEIILKRLDWFLILEILYYKVHNSRSWLDWGGGLDHSSVLSANK